MTESYGLNADFVVQFSSEHWLRPEGALWDNHVTNQPVAHNLQNVPNTMREHFDFPNEISVFSV